MRSVGRGCASRDPAPQGRSRRKGLISPPRLGPISVASDAANQFASKHFDVRAHYLREQARDGALELAYVPTTLNWADGMTKSLAAPAFTAFAHALGVHARPASRSSPS